MMKVEPCRTRAEEFCRALCSLLALIFFTVSAPKLAAAQQNPTETPTRPDWVFQGWNTQCDGSGTSHAAGGQVTLPSSGMLELCAQWAPLLAATPGNESLADSGSENIPPLSVSLFGMSIAAALYSVNQWRRLRLGAM